MGILSGDDKGRHGVSAIGRAQQLAQLVQLGSHGRGLYLGRKGALGGEYGERAGGSFLEAAAGDLDRGWGWRWAAVFRERTRS